MTFKGRLTPLSTFNPLFQYRIDLVTSWGSFWHVPLIMWSLFCLLAGGNYLCYFLLASLCRLYLCDGNLAYHPYAIIFTERCASRLSILFFLSTKEQVRVNICQASYCQIHFRKVCVCKDYSFLMASLNVSQDGFIHLLWKQKDAKTLKY